MKNGQISLKLIRVMAFFMLLAMTLLAPLWGWGSNIQTTNVSLEVVKPIQLNKTKDLSFGAIVRQATGGTVALDPSDESVKTTGGTSVLTSNSTAHSAAFQVSGQKYAHFSILIPADNSVVLKHNNGIETIPLRDFTIAGAAETGNQLSGSPLTFTVGATLDISDQSTHPFGEYTGTFVITVVYE